MKLIDWMQRHPIRTLIVVALAVRILPATVRFVIGSDEGLFLTMAQNLISGRGYTGDGITVQYDFPPGFSLFAAAVYRLGGGPELPARLNILFIGALLPLSIFWLADQLTDRRTALVAGLLTSLVPALVLAQGNFESVAEQPYALLLYTAWGLLWWGLQQRRLLAFGLAGLLVGMAHLVRWEGVIMAVMAAGIIVLVLRQKAWGPVVLFSLVVACFAVPYGLYLQRNTGSFFSPKTRLTQLHAVGLDADRLDPWAFEKSFQEQYEIWLANPRVPVQIPVVERPPFPIRYGRNLWLEIRLWFTSLSFMTIVWVIPFAVGLWAMRWGRTLFLVLLFIPLGAIAASVVDPRYFLIPLPIMMIFAARGWTWLIDRLPQVRLPILARSISPAAVWLGGALLLFLLADLTGPFLYPRPTGYRTAGLALRDEIPPGAHILARKRQLPFYAAGAWEWLPYADLDGVLAYAAAEGADYLVFDRFTTPTLRPQLAYLLDPTQAPVGLTPIYVDANGDVVVYRIERGKVIENKN